MERQDFHDRSLVRRTRMHAMLPDLERHHPRWDLGGDWETIEDVGQRLTTGNQPIWANYRLYGELTQDLQDLKDVGIRDLRDLKA